MRPEGGHSTESKRRDMLKRDWPKEEGMERDRHEGKKGERRHTRFKARKLET